MKQIEYQKREEGRLVMRFFANEQEAEKIDRNLHSNGHAFKAHGNSRQVLIWGDVDHETYKLRIKNHGAKPISQHAFPSAMAASLHFGYRFNAVAQALAKAKKCGEAEAVVCGIPLRRADETTGID